MKRRICLGDCNCPSCQKSIRRKRNDAYDQMRAASVAMAQVESEEAKRLLWAFRTPVICELACRQYRVEKSLFFSNCRTAHVAAARQEAAYLLRRLTGYSFPEIGRILGRDHSSIIHAYNLIAKRMMGTESYGRRIAKNVQLIEAMVPPAEQRQERAA